MVCVTSVSRWFVSHWFDLCYTSLFHNVTPCNTGPLHCSTLICVRYTNLCHSHSFHVNRTLLKSLRSDRMPSSLRVGIGVHFTVCKIHSSPLVSLGRFGVLLLCPAFCVTGQMYTISQICFLSFVCRKVFVCWLLNVPATY